MMCQDASCGMRPSKALTLVGFLGLRCLARRYRGGRRTQYENNIDDLHGLKPLEA